MCCSKGWESKARQLYNAFNRADPPGDLLHALWLPVAENGKIEVEFAGEPGVRYDALIVFSEGTSSASAWRYYSPKYRAGLSRRHL